MEFSRFRAALILFVIFGVATYAWSAPLDGCMASYNQLDCHIGGYCDTNVRELLSIAVKKSGNHPEALKDSHVLYLQRTDGKPLLATPFPGTPPSSIGSFHVVLEHEGKIFDPDFKQAGASAGVPIQDYMKRMFRAGSSINPEVKVQTIPAHDFLNEYGGRSPSGQEVNYRYYLSFNEAKERYPVRTYDPEHPEKSINRGLSPQPLHKSPEVLVEAWEPGSIVSREKGFQIELKTETGKIRKMPEEGWPDGLLDRLLREVENRAQTDKTIQERWSQYLKNKGNTAKPKPQGLLLASPAGRIELEEIQLGTVAFHEVKISSEASFEQLIEQYATRNPDMTEFRLDLSVYGLSQFKELRSRGVSATEAMKRNPLYRALRSHGFEISSGMSSLDDEDPFLTMTKVH